VVEDDPDNRLTIGAILDDLGRRHVHAADGDQAVRMAAELGPALILMDVQLPGVSGVEAARAILSEPRTAGIPILALTDEAMPGDRERLLAAGFREYLAKPMNRDELARVLDRWLGSRGGKPGCSLDDGQPG
jgi:CheY-like chemotaxis protein